MKWHEIDSRWEIWGITSKEDFAKKFVVLGKFQSKVPKDVIDAFETVTHLMAYSYYHYPMLDVAMDKALLIMEMAVKLKAQQLGIELKRRPNKTGKAYDKALNEIIAQVCKQNELAFLKPDFDRARHWRNTRMHPKKNTFSGPIGNPHRNAKLFINIINKLFLDKNELSYINRKQTELKENLKKFYHGLFVLEYKKRKILITSIDDLKYIKNGTKEFIILFIQPVIEDIISAATNFEHTPLVLGFSKIEFNNHNIIARGLDGSEVKVYPNTKQENLPVWEKYENDWASLTEYQRNEFVHYNAREALWKMEELTYQYCW